MATNEYTAMLKILNHIGSETAIANKFSDLAIVAEDEFIKAMALELADRMTPRSSKKGAPDSVINLARRVKASLSIHPDPGAKEFVRFVEAAKHASEVALASKDPEWMIKARSHGWTPPAPSQQNS